MDNNNINQNLNYNSLENNNNNSNSSHDKYSNLVDHSALKKYSKLYFILTIISAIFLVLYAIRWPVGLSYLNPTPNDILENILSIKIPFLNTINCTDENSRNNPIFQYYPAKETQEFFNYKRIAISDQKINKICGYNLIARFSQNATFSHSCFSSLFFREADCPVSQISGISISEIIYDSKLIVNSKREKYFVYNQKIIP